MLKLARSPFEEVVVQRDGAESKAEILKHSPSHQVPRASRASVDTMPATQERRANALAEPAG